MAGATTLAGSRSPDPDGARSTPAVAEGRGHFRPDIEGLRAIAVGLVLADHVFGWPAGGFIGVDVFFVISGFLITSLLVRERARTGRISFRGFYARRARRLFPAAFLTLAATTAAAWFVVPQRPLPGDRRRRRLGGAVQRQHQLRAAGHRLLRGDRGAVPRAALLVAGGRGAVLRRLARADPARLRRPLPCRARRRRAAPRGDAGARTVALWILLGTVTAASFAWSVHATGSSPATAYFSTFTRAWELGVGALVAVTAAQLHRVPAPVRAALAWTGLAGVVYAAFLFDEGTSFPGTAAALPVLGTAALVAWGATPGGPGTRWLLASPPAGYLGAISYSLYLWHWPVLILAGALVLPGSAIFYAAVVGASLLLASFSYYCVEQPVLHSNWLLRHRPVDPARARPVFRRARTVAARDRGRRGGARRHGRRHAVGRRRGRAGAGGTGSGRGGRRARCGGPPSADPSPAGHPGGHLRDRVAGRSGAELRRTARLPREAVGAGLPPHPRVERRQVPVRRPRCTPVPRGPGRLLRRRLVTGSPGGARARGLVGGDPDVRPLPEHHHADPVQRRAVRRMPGAPGMGDRTHPRAAADRGGAEPFLAGAAGGRSRPAGAVRGRAHPGGATGAGVRRRGRHPGRPARIREPADLPDRPQPARPTASAARPTPSPRRWRASGSWLPPPGSGPSIPSSGSASTVSARRSWGTRRCTATAST